METKRGLRKSGPEEMMVKALEKSGIEVSYNFPIRCKYGYILDFAIVDLKIDIECDGEVWHKIGNKKDHRRNWVLRKMGWKVLRFRGKQIKEDIESCIKIIKFNIDERRLEKDGKI